MAHSLSKTEFEIFDALQQQQGARIKFNCDNVTYEGIIDEIIPESRHVVLRHSKAVKENAHFGNLRFRFGDISSFIVVESASSYSKNEYLISILKNRQTVKNDTILKTLFEDLSDDDEDDIGDKKTEEQFVLDLPEHLKTKLPEDYKIINALNEDFYQAIECIARQQVIGVSFHEPSVSRFEKLTWVCISTELCIFLFDIQEIGEQAFDKGLRITFESKSVIKVIHDCMFPSDCLAHQYATVLANVFDTRVADFVANKQRHNDVYEFDAFSTLDTCLRVYLKVPEAFILKRETCSTQAFYRKRPISNAYLYDLIKSVAYLKLLHEIFHKQLLGPFHKLTDFYKKVLSAESQKVINYIGDIISPPDKVPPGILLDGFQTVYFKKPPTIDEHNLICNFIDPQTGKIIKHEGVVQPLSTKKFFFSPEDNKTQHIAQSQKAVSGTSNDTGDKYSNVEYFSIKPSFRYIDEMYYNIVNKKYSNQSTNLVQEKPSLYYDSAICTMTRQLSCSDNSSDFEESKDIWSRLASEIASKATVSPDNNGKRNIKFVPG